MSEELYIRVHLSDASGTYHYNIYRNPPKPTYLSGDNHFYSGSIASGCVLIRSFGGDKRCARVARRHARRIMRDERRRRDTDEIIEAVTLDGQPSRVDLERKIAELEKELEVN